MDILINISIVVATFLSMEFVAWATHKYVMHGFLWILHKDHHQKEPGFFEKNDAFFLIFAVPSATSIILGSTTSLHFLFYIGFGILIYGFAYFLVHDVLIHKRFKWFKNTNHWYLKGILKAHQAHHKHLQKEEGESFGMLLVASKYFRGK